MLKTLLAATTALFLTTAAYASTLKEVSESTYRLHFGSLFVCTAVAISENQLVTAAHCIPNEIRLRGEMAIVIDKWDRTQLLHREIITVNTLRTSKDDDTAFLEIRGDRKLPSYVDIAEEYNPVIGDELFAVGYPRGGELTLTEGMFTTETNLKREMDVDGTYWKVTVPITGGSSGGGFYKRTLVDGEWDYELIGLATGGYRDVSFQNYISTLTALKSITKGLYNPKDYVGLIAEEK